MSILARTLYDKLWDDHVVHREEDGTCLLYIDRHLVHEVTSPQAFEGLRVAGRQPWRTSSVVATADHNTPTTGWERGIEGIEDLTSREQVVTLDRNIREFAISSYFPFLDQRQGIVHVIGPEQGATLPGMTVVCGDSHTSTHGALGCLAFGIGTAHRLPASQRLNRRLQRLAVQARFTRDAARLAFVISQGQQEHLGGDVLITSLRGFFFSQIEQCHRFATHLQVTTRRGLRPGIGHEAEETIE
jgi:homoaconitase/3-isopropylmalate dehydratase large subunit